MEWTVKIPLPLLTSPFVDLNKAGGVGLERSKEVTCLWVVFSVLEFICSSSATSVQLESAGPGWVPGCPISDPLADEIESKVGLTLFILDPTNRGLVSSLFINNALKLPFAKLT